MGTPSQRSSPKWKKNAKKRRSCPNQLEKIDQRTRTHNSQQQQALHSAHSNRRTRKTHFFVLFFLYFLDSGDRHEVIMGQQKATRQGFQPHLLPLSPPSSLTRIAPPCICGGVRFSIYLWYAVATNNKSNNNNNNSNNNNSKTTPTTTRCEEEEQTSR